MYRFILTIVFLSFISCQKTPEQFSYTPNYVEKPLLVSEIGESLDIIEIQTKYPISGYPTILKSDQYYYLFEEGLVTSLHQVGLDGKVRKSIDFGYDDKLNADGITQVILRENGVGVISRGTSIIWFDEDLIEQETETLPFKANFHFPINENEIISFTNRINEDEDFDILIQKNGLISRALPIDRAKYGFVYQTFSPFISMGGKILFSQSFNDTIFQWDHTKFEPLIHVNFGSEAITKERYSKISHALDMLEFFNEKKYSYLQGEIYGLNENKIMFKLSHKGKQKVGVMDFKSKELTAYSGIVDNSISGMLIYFPQFSQNGELFFGISGEQILENYDRIPDSFKHRLSKDYAESYFIYRLKVKGE